MGERELRGEAELEQPTRAPHARYATPWLFFVATFTLTWAFWVPAALLGREFSAVPVFLLIITGGLFGKALPPVILTFLAYDPEGRRDFWSRVIDFRRISAGWYAAILLMFPTFSVLAILTDIATGGSMPALATAARLLSDPLALAQFAVFALIFGPLPEELGWRGYVLDRL